ncbi:MAG TPA: hypothetical protein VFX45_12045 [Solirubrobacterales bacterium]|nr:hypothetical protein [Solirubrobacterales bacterium]
MEGTDPARADAEAPTQAQQTEKPTTKAPEVDKSAEAAPKEETWSDRMKAVGGLIAVIVGVVVVGLIAFAAILKDGSNASTIATGCAGVVATIVGAYFGVKMGNDRSKDAAKDQKAEAAKAQVFAAHLPPTEAEDILALAETAARRATKL